MPKKRKQPPSKKPPPPSSSTKPFESHPVFFHNPTQGNGYLSQWYWTPFTHNHTTYETAEKWMMLHKAAHFSDTATYNRILATTCPSKAKALGRGVKGFDPDVWDTVKEKVVYEGNVLKFTISEDAEKLRGKLLATGERELVEASARDRVWGIGFREKDALGQRQRWGGNLLGRVLMDVRGELRERERREECAEEDWMEGVKGEKDGEGEGEEEGESVE